MLKVLMFGWEYPPHISGGLGTACYGLTRSLANEGIRLTFVVPTLRGARPQEHPLRVLDAGTAAKGSRKSLRRRTIRHYTTVATRRTKKESHGENVEEVVIPSALAPYQSPDPLREYRRIQHWNYPLNAARATDPATAQFMNTETINTQATGIESADDNFQFTGAYGPNLLHEVQRYAVVSETIARNHAFDVIHVHDWMTFQAGIRTKETSGKPLVVHVHSTEFDRSGEKVNPEVFQIEKAGFEIADRIIAVSNWTKNIIQNKYGIEKEKITVVHNGVTPRGDMKDFAFPSIGSHFVTFLGRVTHQKGPGYFVEAAKKVLREFPEAHFIVAGAGELLPQIIDRVAQLNMSSHFHFTGFLSGEQVDQVWALTDVYVMPSVSEPFGIAPLEAIQRGVPVILSKQSGVAEVMPHAIKVDFWDTESVASAICSVLRYDSLSHELRQNSKKHIDGLSWDKAAQDVKAVYHELTGKY